ncbi:MAG: mannose-1-phosphate guanylyltransferase [Salibacteraceae bacterium]
MSNQFAVIMAGGVGSRFWPKSTEKNPKQFLDVLGVGRTLIQLTFDRFNSFIPAENILVVTNEGYIDLVKKQLPRVLDQNILAEPCMRNTAPCVAYAVKKIESQNPNAVMIVTPADHLISKVSVFEKVMHAGLSYVSENAEILTIGIEPDRPNTGYGYIEYSKNAISDGVTPVKVEQFKEKPNLKTAKEYLANGNFSWNSGMFLWSLDTIKRSFAENAPEVMQFFETNSSVYNTEKETDFINQVYARCPSISIDYAVLEKANNVSVINTDIGWSDIGTWVSLQNHINKSVKGNFIISGDVLMEDSTGNIVSLPEGKILATKGLDNFIVVESEGVLMIVAKEYEQNIKQLRGQVGELYGEDKI